MSYTSSSSAHKQKKYGIVAALIKESGKAGLGFVAQNESGNVLLSGARVECFVSSPLEAEAKAIFWSFVKRVGTKVAHSIATWALGRSGEIILESRLP
ncbi:hypothetical protein Tco_1578824, partial [Tanacetum coccineum]